MRTLRRFVAPVIGCALIIVILVPVLQNIRRQSDPNVKMVDLCMNEARKNHPGPWDPHIVAFVAPSPLGGGASFSFREKATGQSWDTRCAFDGSGKLKTATTLPASR